MSEERYCTECRSAIPPRADVCPSCGVFAGDLFDGRTDVQKSAIRKRIITAVAALLIACAAFAAWYFLKDRPEVRALIVKPAPKPVASRPVRVVHDRPGTTRRGRGAAITEAEAVLLLRQSLGTPATPETQPVKDECIAILSNGFRSGVYIFTAVNRCDRTRLGRWQVDAKTREVSRASIAP